MTLEFAFGKHASASIVIESPEEPEQVLAQAAVFSVSSNMLLLFQPPLECEGPRMLNHDPIRMLEWR